MNNVVARFSSYYFVDPCNAYDSVPMQTLSLLEHIHKSRAGLSVPEALGKLSIGGPLPTYVEDKKRSSPPQIVEFECISDQNVV